MFARASTELLHRIIAALHTRKSIASRFEGFQTLQAAFESGSPAVRDASMEERQKWLLKDLPGQMLRDREDLNKQDGIAIAEMYTRIEGDGNRLVIPRGVGSNLDSPN